jgi:hypothetical protein
MGGQGRDGTFLIVAIPDTFICEGLDHANSDPGGKAKPLKAPKKEKKELDEDDKAFLEKKKAGKDHATPRIR